jgi:serine/threonine protein kinase/tetratricopeptide (TPR) repeat protein
MRPDLNSPDLSAEVWPEAEQDRLAQILDEYLVAAERGEPIGPEELIAKYPADAAHLRRYLSGLQFFHDAAVSPATPRPTLLNGGGPRTEQVIGDYRLMREIGRGGMGVVYEAEQISLHRRVALKILPFTAGHDDKHICRFRNEAQAAAQVQHPHIVPVYAIGEEHGTHYYAMQLIEGQSLATLLEETRSFAATASCGTTAPQYVRTVGGGSNEAQIETRSEHATSPAAEPRIASSVSSRTSDHVRAIARLGIQAAEALHAAHEYGVVHRDVKPSNLLVDDHGKLWVTDFGLARCRETRGLTQTGDVLGTMRYMSPEQALGRSALIDHRTDIFSLGVTLYELATLHHPAGNATDVQLMLDRTRFTCKSLRHWNPQIPVDFETVVLKSIAEFPHERYTSAQEFADDLRRFEEGRPIQASPPSLLSRATKWAGRHRGSVAAAAAVLVVAFAGLFATLFFVAREKMATDRALVKSRGHLHQVNEVLDRFGSKLVDQLAAIPGAEGVRHQLLEDISQLYEEFGQQAAGDPALSADLAKAYSKMGRLSERMGNHQAALERQLRALHIWEASIAKEPGNDEYVRNLALTHNNIGLLQMDSGKVNDALNSFQKAERVQRRLLSVAPQNSAIATELATTYGNLGLALRNVGDREQARKMFRESIALHERRLTESPGDESALRGQSASYNNLGSLDESTPGDDAAENYKQAIDIQHRLVKNDPINRIYQGDLARTYNNLGYLLARQSDWRNAEISYTDAIALQEHLLVKASPLAASYLRDLAISFNNLGMAQSGSERRAAAENSFRLALALQDVLIAAEEHDAKTLSNQGSVWNNLGMLFNAQARFSEAEGAYQHAIEYQRKALDAAPEQASFRRLLDNHYVNFAECLRKQNKRAAADEIQRQRKSLAAIGTNPTPLN